MKRTLPPILILSLGLLVAWFMPTNRLVSEAEEPRSFAPTVSVIEARPTDFTMTVTAHGTVEPRTEIELVAQVRGKVAYVAPSFAAGGFFSRGDLLVAIDPEDYELAVTRAEAAVAEARQILGREQAEADLAAEEWRLLGNGAAPDPRVLREPQLLEARARLTAAEADLALAKLELQRTAIRAPFDGRVRAETIDGGSYVSAGQTMAQIYATDVAEIRLPLGDRQLQYLNLPLLSQPGRHRQSWPKVTISAKFAGRHHLWLGQIVRTEGTIDPESRFLYAVAEIVAKPALDERLKRPPLSPGMFVRATINGTTAEHVFALPRDALHRQGQVLVVDRDEVLRTRPVEILRDERDRVVIGHGLRTGERVVVDHPAGTIVGAKVQAEELGGPGTPAIVEVLSQ